MGGLLTMYALRSIWDFLFKLEVLIHFRHALIFRTGFSIKKEQFIPQTPSIRGRNHSYFGGTTSYGGFNGKITITLSFYPSQEKNDTLW
jgi:hypothetical protein